MRKIIGFFVLGGILIGLVGCQSDSSKRDILNPKPSTAYIAWQDQHKGVEAVLWQEADVNADGLEDTILIYKETSTKCWMTVIIAGDQGFTTLEPVPAPVENQRIQFKDIDSQEPLEFIISGSKGANIGYAIYRIEDGRITDLFGQDMDRCC